MRNRTKIAATAGAALAIAGAGAAVAADRLAPRDESRAVLDDAAKQLGIEPAKLNGALKQALKNRIDALVQDGVLTREQGDAAKERIQALEVPLLTAPLFGHDRFRAGPFGGPRAFSHHLGGDLDAAARYLGIEKADVKAALRDGKSLAALAKEKHKSVEGLVEALVAAEKQKLQEAVDAGRLTDAQRDRIVEGLQDRIESFVQGGPPRPHRLPFRPGALLPSLQASLDAAASYLGMDRSELGEALEGTSLAALAKEKGKSVDGLVDAIVAAAKQELQEAVDDGRLTDARRDRIAGRLEELVTGIVNGDAPFLGSGPHGRFFGSPIVGLPHERAGDD